MIPISFVNKQHLPKKDVKYGQIIIVKNKPKSDPLDPDLDMDIELITKPIKDLKDQYPTVQFPTSGVEPSEKVKDLLHDVQKKNSSDSLRDIQRYNQYRQLLIARKMSQLVAKTWLDADQINDPEDKVKFPIIKKLILLGNQPPELEKDEVKAIKDLASGYQIEDELEIIIPGRLNWQSAYLNLLLAGQTYLQKDDGTLSLLHESILSTFESVNLYAFKLVFDQFVSKAQELFSPGSQPLPPYYLWTFPYPPRSRTDESSQLSPQMIKAWAYAAEEGGTLPFYSTSNGEIEGVEYVYPPYPYMAGSH